MISSTAESKAAHRHAALQQIEHRLTIVLAKMANLKVEQARLQAESAELMQRREWIIPVVVAPPSNNTSNVTIQIVPGTTWSPEPKPPVKAEGGS